MHRRTERELYIELASEHERREEGAEEAYFHFVDSVVRSSNSFVSPLDDRAYTNLVNSDEMGEAWEQLSRDERDVHYGAVGAILGPDVCNRLRDADEINSPSLGFGANAAVVVTS